MSELSYFFDGTDKSYGSESFASMFGTFINNGVVDGFGNKLNPSFGTGMVLLIDTGRAWVRGRYYENTASVSLSISAANATNPRIDRVVLRLDVTNRNIGLAIKTGTPAASPVTPTLTQNSTIYELPICRYTVTAGATLPTNLVDERQYNSLIGQASVDTSGWNPITATLTYASATTINTSVDLTGVIPLYAKFRYKQGGSYKYGYVTGVTATVLTILAGSDYSVTNATITNVAWSVSDPAVGFPKVFNYTPTITSYSGTFTTLGTCIFPFCIANNRLYFDENISIVTNGTAAGDIESTLPLPIAGATDVFAGGREWNVAGKLLTGRLVRSMNKILISNSDATYPGGNGYALILSGNYPI